MNDYGGPMNEPTSYGLQPPRSPQHGPVPPQHGPVPTQHVPVPPQAAPGAGPLVGGRYRLLSRLGHGGMGTVWRARDEVVDRDVAVKEPRVPDHLSEQERANIHLRMQREARAAARIEHPSVVTVHDVVVEAGRPWVVMELVSGQSLGDRLQEGTLDPREAARIGFDVLAALTAAHEAGVLHRDVKPDNVLLGRGDRVVLTDFGIAQIEGEQRLTETGAFVGSPEFVAPERLLGQRPGPASDLWSLGVVLYAAVEGMSPFRRTNTPATLQAVLSAEPQSPARGSGAFGALVMRLLSKDPAARPGPTEIRAALEAVARPVPSSAPTQTAGPAAAGTVAPQNRWLPPVLAQSRGARYGLLAGLLAIAVATTLLVTDPFGGDEPLPGWQVRPERELLGAEVTVPQDYKRSQEDGDGVVWFSDPSGVFEIDFWRTEAGGDDLGPGAAARKAKYERGGNNGLEMKDPKVTVKETQHQGRKASELVVDYTPYSSSGDDPVRYRYHELLIPGEGKTYWHLRVKMPAAGKAAGDGEGIYTEVVKGLRIEDFSAASKQG
ncbi:serine/threonine-protein kinase [Streptomyces solicathayae]|uniref:non-specific serine/threonine protein kinase n=1 Tax=Streptomyces solicathayae TaxID=3081768 RepID=A0ABZ0LT19_9ACTN|nr:serine/threonine-protein kinase [Streptomyces sp. HUAS YS2]WOX22606.1 serine/threonine-protein kinase [Streptomyces sp. HUAS YS2]